MNRAIIWIVVIVALVYFTQQPEINGAQAASTPTTTVAAPEDPTTPLTSMLPPADSVRRVLIIGDSLTLGISPHWPSNGEKLRVDINAQEGRPLQHVNKIVTEMVEQTDAYVLALGTNDCVNNPNEDQIRDLIISALNTNQAKPVLLLTLGENGKIRDCAVRFNQVAKRLAASIPSLELGDWQALAREHPEWYGANGDGIHLTPDGYQARAEWLNSLITP